ncbi:MAG: hypothetical protein ABIJ08_06260 [Nanoarchaeota archaeon]
MNLTKDEKETIRFLIEKQLKEVENEEVLRDVSPKFLAADVKYDEFLKNLLKKIK